MSDSKWAIDSEWYEDGKLKRVRVGRIVLLPLFLVLCALLGYSPVGIWRILEMLLKYVR